jgi:Holliday junction DNA helicase RuvA
LYGFTESSEKDLFELVQTVSGIGPKVALAISAAMNYEDLAVAISTKNVSAIEAIPGIGKKSAQRMILELDGKMIPAHQVTSTNSFSSRDQLIEALLSLGFNRKQAEKAVNDLGAAHQPSELSELTPSELLKLALSQTGVPANAKNLSSKKGHRK